MLAPLSKGYCSICKIYRGAPSAELIVINHGSWIRRKDCVGDFGEAVDVSARVFAANNVPAR